VIGLALLIADYIGSFKHERELVWKAPPCIMKYGFLLNRYLIPACLIAIFIPLSGFLGLNFTDSVRVFPFNLLADKRESCRSVNGSLM
jgi:hypothetical protein